LRVRGIFTPIAISPSPSLRQCSSRYTIRAGRNLPDKGFRYLRTVIVTAAAYRGFGSKLWAYALTSFLNLPALGRYQPLYLSFSLWQRPVILLCSRLSLFSASALRRTPFFRSYGVKLPSSLTRVLSNTLGYLPPSTSVGLRYGHPTI
jgi:hypothetical protein